MNSKVHVVSLLENTWYMESYDEATCANVAGDKVYYHLIVRYRDAKTVLSETSADQV